MLFDPTTWDGNLDSLPPEIRSKVQSKPDTQSADDKAFEDRVTAALNKRTTQAHLDGVRGRVSADKYEEASSRFRRAVEQGGLSVDQAEKLYFPPTTGGEDTLTKPPVDPAGGGSTPSGGTPSAEWTDERVSEQRGKLRRMPMSEALSFRRDPANKKYLVEEMKLYNTKSAST